MRTLSIRRLAAGLGLLLLLGVIATFEDTPPPPPDLAHFVPDDAEWAIFIPPLETLETNLLPWARELGLAGALSTWVEAHVGITLDPPGAGATSGVHPKGESVVFGRGAVRGVLLPVLSGPTMEALVATRSALWAGDGNESNRTQMKWVRKEDCLFVGWGPDRALQETMDHLANTTPSTRSDGAGSEETFRGFLRLDSDRVGGVVDQWMAPLGSGAPFVAGMVNGWLRGLGRWSVTVDFREEGVLVSSHAGREGERALSHGPSALESTPGAWLPSNTTALFRLNLNPASLLRDLQWVVRRLGSPTLDLARWGGADVNIVDDLLPGLRGDVSVAVLGLRAGVPALSPLRATNAAGVFRSLDWMAVVGLSNPARVRQLLAVAVEGSGVSGSPCAFAWTEPWAEGVPLVRVTCTGMDPWIVGVLERSLVLWGGDSSHGASRDVAGGRLKSLDSRVQGEHTQKLLSAEPELGGVHLGFTRITRELAERGVPPYQLRALGRVRGIGFRIRSEDGPLELNGEVVQ